jgi:hypothetical protein
MSEATSKEKLINLTPFSRAFFFSKEKSDMSTQSYHIIFTRKE